MSTQDLQQYNGVMQPMGYSEYRAPPMTSPFQQPFQQLGGYPPPRGSVNFNNHQYQQRQQIGFYPPPPMYSQQQRHPSVGGGRGFSHSAPRGYSHQSLPTASPSLSSQGRPVDPRLNRGQPQPPRPPSMPHGMPALPRAMSFPRPPPNNAPPPNFGGYGGYGGGDAFFINSPSSSSV